MSAPLEVMTNASATVSREPRLTSLSHGGGCGCKIAPGVLAELLKGSLPSRHYADLLVGTETSDDAAVYRLNDDQAVIATIDFFMPIVDDPLTLAASPPPTPCRTSMPWVARRSWRSPLSACRSTCSHPMSSAIFCAAARRSAHRPTFPLPAVIASIRWSLSTAWLQSD